MAKLTDCEVEALAKIAGGGWTWSAAPPHWRDGAGQSREVGRLVRLGLIDVAGDDWKVSGPVVVTPAGSAALPSA